MAQSNPFDQFDSTAQPVPVAQIAPLRPILTDPNKERERQLREESAANDATRTDIALRGEQRTQQDRDLSRLDTYRKEFLADPTVRQFKDVEAATRQIVDLAKNGGGDTPGPADVALITSYMKALDPGSTVREGEFATAQNAGGIPETVRNYYNKITEGGRLSPQLRKEFADTAIGLYNSRRGPYNSFAETYRNLVSDAGADPDKQGIRLAADIVFDAAPAGAAPRKEVTGTGNFASKEDAELQALLNEQWSKGATLETLQALAGPGRRIGVSTQEELDRLREQGATIVVDPTGQRSQAGELIGAAADSPVGAYAVGATNALTLGAMDELAPLIGLDADTVQAAKEMLRERYPVSSFAGEVSGGAMQAVAGGTALRGLGVGAPGLAGAEIAQGAAYGAGEANDSRLMGAGLGAGATVVGQQIGKAIASRFATPEAQAALGKVAAETGAPPEAVQEAIIEAADRIPGTARPSPTVTPEAETQFGEVARMAVGRGAKARAAQEQLAIAAKINPEAKAAAERLGIVLPLDVISDDARLLTAAGATRSLTNSVAESEWGATVKNAVERADATLAEIGASRDLAQLSDDVRSRFMTQAESLKDEADVLRGEVNSVLNPSARVTTGNTRAKIDKLVEKLGGIEDAKNAFTAEEKKLLAMIGYGETAKQPTYAMLNLVRDQIGRAIYKNEGPWVDAPKATLKEYYGALAADQVRHIESTFGQDLADKFRGSNDLYTKMFQSREVMETLFGQQLEKDIGGLVNRTITNAAKGDAKDLRTLLSGVPEDMRARTLLTGVMSQADKGSSGGGFSFEKYAKLYRGIRQNEPIYQEIAKTVGPEATRIMQDLYVLSSRMSAAQNKISMNGKSALPILNALKAESLTARTMEATKKVGARGAGAVVGATVGSVGGPAGSAMGAAAGQEAGAAMLAAITQGGKANTDKLHTLLSSEGFRDLVEKIGTGEGVEKAINRVANDGPFRRFARSVLSLKNPEDRKSWLMRAIEISPTVAGVEATTQEQPAMIEVR